MNKKIIVFSLLFFSTFLSAAEWEDLVAVFKAPYDKKNIKLIENALKECPEKRIFELLSTKDDKDYCVTMLYKAARAGDEDLLKLLLRWCPKKKVYDYLILGDSFAGITPLCVASCAKCFDALMYACPPCKRYDYLSLFGDSQRTAIFTNTACALKYLANFSSQERWMLLKKVDDEGNTILHYLTGASMSCYSKERRCGLLIKALRLCPPNKAFDFISIKNNSGEMVLLCCVRNDKVFFVEPIMSFCPIERRCDLLMKMEDFGPFGSYDLMPLSWGLVYASSGLESFKCFLNEHIKAVYAGDKIRHDWAKKLLGYLFSKYSQYKGQDITFLIRKAICDIFSLCLYSPKKVEILLEHKKNLDKYINLLIQGKRKSVPLYIIDYYDVLVGSVSREREDKMRDLWRYSWKDCVDIKTNFCTSPYILSRTLSCAIAKKSLIANKTKDMTYMNKNLKKIIQGEIKKKTIAPDVEFVFE